MIDTVTRTMDRAVSEVCDNAIQFGADIFNLVRHFDILKMNLSPHNDEEKQSTPNTP